MSETSMSETTLMLQNIPRRLTEERLRAVLDRQGFAHRYNSVYVPLDRSRRGASKGFAFANALVG